MKTVVKIVLKLFAGCLVVLTVSMFGLGIYAFASPSSNPDDLTQKISSRVYQFLGKEYSIPETKYEKQEVAYTNITENSDEVPTDDLFFNSEIPTMSSVQYLKMKSSHSETDYTTGELYSSNESFEYKFDKSGKLLKELYTDGNGNVWTYVYLYNSHDQLSTYISRSYTGRFSVDTYEYDAKGRLVHQATDSNSTSQQCETKWQYNDNGQISQIDWSNSSGEYCTVFSYKNGNPVKETFYEDGESTGWRINSYDSNGHRVKAVKYSPDGTVEDTWVLEYDSSGNCTSRKRYTGNSSVADWEISYEYDRAGHQTLLKDRTVSDTREDTTVTESEYDKNGNLIKKSQEATGNSCGGSFVHTYTYDKNNNLIEDVNVYGADDSSTSQYEYQSIYDHMTENATSSSIFNNVFSNNLQDKFVGKWELYYVTSGQEFRMFDNSAYFEIYSDGTAKEYINGYTSYFTYQVNKNNPSELIFTDSDSGDPTIFSINDDGVLIGKMDEFDIEIAFIRLDEQQEEANS